METRYDSEFVHFIKTVLINSCYDEYCRQINNCLKTGIKYGTLEFRDALINYKNEKRFWDVVFGKVHDLFMYYLHLSTNYQNILVDQPKITYKQSKLVSTYSQMSFQDYIDDSVNFLKVGYREYVNFTKSMQDTKFKAKMVERYNVDTEIRILKNHLIYVIQLRLAKNVGNSNYFTEEECDTMDIMINVIPYFEHMNKTTNAIPSTNALTAFNELEERVLEKIDNMI
jgi:hypothetical protein